ncbi:MAG: FKBP-type peptidyl-prolyl cis-trans isomerase [Elusimicrobiales bacterium]|nr:FKBP-type peptidyl-prolyl cis-trans isomerase [Elusimicrobiales bacterium]
MKKLLIAVFACFITGAAAAADAPKPAAAPKAQVAAPAAQGGLTEDQKTLYFLGQAVSSKIKQFEFTKEEAKYIIQGFSESLAGQKSKADETYGMKLNAFLAKKQEAIVAKQKGAAKPFLDKMAKEKGAEKLPSGVIYIPVKEGTGVMPKATDMVKVHYHGTFPDGKVFDSSVERGTPAEFPLSGVIPCWTEGVQKIKVGGKAKLVCPSDTAYGDQGAGGAIPGGATLVFDVELLEIMKESAPAVTEEKPAAEVKPATEPAKAAVKK